MDFRSVHLSLQKNYEKIESSQNNLLLLLKEMLLGTNMWTKKEFLDEMTTKMP